MKTWSVLELSRRTFQFVTIVVSNCCCEEKWIFEEFRIHLKCHMRLTVDTCKIAMKNCYKVILRGLMLRSNIIPILSFHVVIPLIEIIDLK